MLGYKKLRSCFILSIIVYKFLFIRIYVAQKWTFFPIPTIHIYIFKVNIFACPPLHKYNSFNISREGRPQSPSFPHDQVPTSFNGRSQIFSKVKAIPRLFNSKVRGMDGRTDTQCSCKSKNYVRVV